MNVNEVGMGQRDMQGIAIFNYNGVTLISVQHNVCHREKMYLATVCYSV